MRLAIYVFLFGVVALFGRAAAASKAPKAEDTFTESVARAIDVYLDQRQPDFERPKAVRLFLISPVAYSDAEYAEARRTQVDAEPFWIGGLPHKVFREISLPRIAAIGFARNLFRDLTYQKSHDEFRLLSLCLFRPMHAFEVSFADGKKLEGAICVHCSDLMFRLPRPVMEEYRGVQTRELTEELTKLLPIPKALEAEFFPAP
jgi:hypothetical protein